MKRVALISFLFLTLILTWTTNSQAFLGLQIGENEVPLDYSLPLIDGVFMAPLWVFEEFLGAEVSWATEFGEIEMVFPDQVILMRLNRKSAQVNDKVYNLDVPPQSFEDEVIVPLRFVADRQRLSLVFDSKVMKLLVKGSDYVPTTTRMAKQPINEHEEIPAVVMEATLKDLEDNVLDKLMAGMEEEMSVEAGEESSKMTPEESIVNILEPPVENKMIDLERPKKQDLRGIRFMGGQRARVFIDLESYTYYETNLLTEPDRFVLDIFGVEGDSIHPVYVEDPIVSRIRSSRFDQDTMRIVCDLKGSTGYKVLERAGAGIEIEFNYQLSDLTLEELGDMFALRFRGSATPVVNVLNLVEPRRLVLDFQETTLMDGAAEYEFLDKKVSRLRISQHLPSVVRVVLESEEQLQPLPVWDGGMGEFILPLFIGTDKEANAFLASFRAELGNSDPVEDSNIEFANTGSILSGVIITLDPGHGGSDPGTIGYQGTFEKDVVLEITKYLGELLIEAGAKVVYTRDKDEYVSIFERPEIAIKAGADLFVSVHVNSHLEKGVARGTETLYRAKDPISEVLARTVQDELVEAITLIDRRIWARDDLAIFNGSKIPAVLVEVGFLDHPDEELLLRAPGFQQIAAQGIFNGIERFYLENMN